MNEYKGKGSMGGGHDTFHQKNDTGPIQKLTEEDMKILSTENVIGFKQKKGDQTFYYVIDDENEYYCKGYKKTPLEQEEKKVFQKAIDDYKKNKK